MIIDIHTHTFPYKIAARAIEHMEEDIVRGQGFEVKCARIPTFQGLSDSTKSAGIDLSVVCPVATNIRQPEKINRLSVELNEKREETTNCQLKPMKKWMKQRCLTLVPFIPTVRITRKS